MPAKKTSKTKKSASLKNSRWKGIRRDHSTADVARLRGNVKIEYSLCQLGANKFWDMIGSESYIHALGAMTGNQAVQQVQAGLRAIYVSGWQVAADANLADSIYPDQSLYPSNSVPTLINKINRALIRADQVQSLTQSGKLDWMVPIIADGEAGFGGPLNVFELTRQMIEAGASAVHYEDQLSSAKKCGHMGGKVLVPASEFITKLKAARLSADVCGAPLVIIARTDANDAKLLTSDIDAIDRKFIIDKNRTVEGFYRIRSGLELAIARACAYAPYADMIWCETSHPDLDEAADFAKGVHAKFPGKPLCYNCSPSFNWKESLNDTTIRKFQASLARMGYKFQFITLAGFHSLNLGMYELASAYHQEDMLAYSKLQEREFKLAKTSNYRATKHQQFVGAGYFDEITRIVSGGDSEVTALKGSTEEEQFKK